MFHVVRLFCKHSMKITIPCMQVGTYFRESTILCHIAHMYSGGYFWPNKMAPQLPLPGGRTCDSRDRGSRHPSSMHVTLNVHVKREDLLKEDAAVLRRCVVDAFSPRPHDPTGTKERARHSGGNAMMLIAMCLSSAVSGSGSELRLAASCLTALLSQY